MTAVALIEPIAAERCGFQRLKAAVHYTVGRICHRIGEERRAEFSRQTIAAITETVVRQCGGWLCHSGSLAIQEVVELFIYFLKNPFTVAYYSHVVKFTTGLLCS